MGAKSSFSTRKGCYGVKGKLEQALNHVLAIWPCPVCVLVCLSVQFSPFLPAAVTYESAPV